MEFGINTAHRNNDKLWSGTQCKVKSSSFRIARKRIIWYIISNDYKTRIGIKPGMWLYFRLQWLIDTGIIQRIIAFDNFKGNFCLKQPADQIDRNKSRPLTIKDFLGTFIIFIFG